MVRRRISAVSNHEAPPVATSFETLASQAPQDEELEPFVAQLVQKREKRRVNVSGGKHG
jgi:hypothetical protein